MAGRGTVGTNAAGLREMSNTGVALGTLRAATGSMSAGVQYGADLSAANAYGLQAAGAEQQGALSQWSYDQQAKAYAQDALSYSATAGEYQQEGLDQAFLRYQQLNEDVGRIRTAAAGSGIDMSSDVVRRVDAQTRQNAAYDVNKIGRNAANKSQSAISQARNAMVQSAYATANGQIAYANGVAQAKAYRAQQQYAEDMAWLNLVSGTVEATVNGITTAFMAS